MIVRYLNSKGEEKLINGILQLQKSNDAFFIASTRSGTELNLRITGIVAIYLEETDTEKAPVEKETEGKTPSRMKAQVYTDGACKGNPGPGGWGAILLVDGKEIELYGGEQSTTNNRMELCAMIEALNHLPEPCDVVLTSDSQYVINSIQKGWLDNWQKNGWKKADKSPVANEELWKELLALLEKHNVEFVWIKGHAGHVYNERCDKLASKFARKFQRL
jgi:ribonuclease HI